MPDGSTVDLSVFYYWSLIEISKSHIGFSNRGFLNSPTTTTQTQFLSQQQF